MTAPANVRERPLTPLMRDVLLVLAGARERAERAANLLAYPIPPESMTCNAIADALRLEAPTRRRGPWSGLMGTGQRVIPVVIGLERRGLIEWVRERPGGLSGGSYRCTDAGLEVVRAGS